MKRFLYGYVRDKLPTSPEQGKALVDIWKAYFAKLVDQIVEGGSPLGRHKSVGDSFNGNPGGYSIINAASLDEAVAPTDRHPHRQAGGIVQVCETMPIPM